MSNELVPTQREGDVYVIMDQLDDRLIKAEIENRISDTWVYTFKADGRSQTGLSKVGVDACCTEMAKSGHVIREGKPGMELDPTNPDYVLFTCPASRLLVSKEDGREILFEVVNGVKRQWTKMRLRNQQVVEDPFWFEKGVAKAGRNARGRLIPEEVRTKIILLAQKDKKRERVHAIETSATTSAGSKASTASAKAAVPKPQQLTDDEKNHVWSLARAGVENDETKARENVKKLLDIVGITATVQLKPADYKKVCSVLEFGEIPKEWEGKLDWDKKSEAKPEPTAQDEAPF